MCGMVAMGHIRTSGRENLFRDMEDNVVSSMRQGQDRFAILNWRQVAAEMNVMFLPTIWHSLSRLFVSGLLAHATL
jgi:hypothetical protein